jgi:hypothetical protein
MLRADINLAAGRTRRFAGINCCNPFTGILFDSSYDAYLGRRREIALIFT